MMKDEIDMLKSSRDSWIRSATFNSKKMDLITKIVNTSNEKALDLIDDYIEFKLDNELQKQNSGVRP